MHVHFNMLGHVWAGVGEEYKLTGFGYTLIFFTELLWSLDLVPFGLPACLECLHVQLQLHQIVNNYNCQQQHLG